MTAKKLYAVMLHLCPPSFRKRWGASMLETLDARAREESGGSFWLAELADLVCTAAREWARVRPAPRPMGRRRRGLALDLVSDARYAMRSLARKPAFTIVALGTMALGIGANTTMFTLVEAVLIRPLAFPEPERLVFANGSSSQFDRAAVSPLDYLDYRERLASFDVLSATMLTSFSVSGGDEGAEQVSGARVSYNFFDALGAAPAEGRGFRVEEEAEGRHRVAVISHGLWQRRFGGRSVLGDALKVDGYLHEIIGVMPPGFQVRFPNDLWVPIAFGTAGTSERRFHFLRLVGRLREDVSLAEAQAEVDTVAGQLADAYPETNEGWTLALMPLRREVVGMVKPALLALEAAVALVLLMVCANLAGVMLARAASRRSEVALRAALGASRARIARLVLTESVLISLAGGALGLLLAYGCLELFRTQVDPRMPRLAEVTLDGSVLAFTAVVSLTAGLFFGMVPALRVTRENVSEALAGFGRVSEPRARRRLQSGLVVAQIGLALVLLVGTLLTLTSLSELYSVDPGFDADQVVTATFSLPTTEYPDAADWIRFYDDLLGRARALPGVASASGITRLPFMGGNDTLVHLPGRPPASTEEQTHVQFRMATEGYFATLQIPLLEGRDLQPQDDESHPPVALLSRGLARQFFGDEGAIGRQLVVDLGDKVTVTIVGVVGDVRRFALSRPPDPTMYLAFRQQPVRYLRIVAKTTIDPTGTLGALRAAAAEVDPQLPASRLTTMQAVVNESTVATRLQASLLAVFAVLAALLAALGLYGVLAQAVLGRQKEMGLRMALGARPARVAAMVLRSSLRLVLVGLLVGLPFAYGAARLAEQQLFGVQAMDPVPFLGVSGLLAVVGLLAGGLPARRAMRVDPVDALRAE